MTAHKGNLQLSPQMEAKLTSLLGAVLLSAGSLLVLSWLVSCVSGSSRPAEHDGSSPDSSPTTVRNSSPGRKESKSVSRSGADGASNSRSPASTSGHHSRPSSSTGATTKTAQPPVHRYSTPGNLRNQKATSSSGYSPKTGSERGEVATKSDSEIERFATVWYLADRSSGETVKATVLNVDTSEHPHLYQIRIHQGNSVKETVKQYLTRNPNIPPAAASSNYGIPARPTTPEEPKKKKESSPGLLSSLTFGNGRKTKDSKASKTNIDNGSRKPGEYLPGDPVWYLNYTQYWIRAQVIKKMPHHDGVYKIQIKDDKSEKAAVADNLKPRKEKRLHGPADE